MVGISYAEVCAMSLARLVITAVRVEGRSKSEVARDYGLSRFWVQQLVKRFAAGTVDDHVRARWLTASTAGTVIESWPELTT